MFGSVSGDLGGAPLPSVEKAPAGAHKEREAEQKVKGILSKSFEEIESFYVQEYKWSEEKNTQL